MFNAVMVLARLCRLSSSIRNWLVCWNSLCSIGSQSEGALYHIYVTKVCRESEHLNTFPRLHHCTAVIIFFQILFTCTLFTGYINRRKSSHPAKLTAQCVNVLKCYLLLKSKFSPNRTQNQPWITVERRTISDQITVKGELNPKIKFVLFERTLKITE